MGFPSQGLCCRQPGRLRPVPHALPDAMFGPAGRFKPPPRVWRGPCLRGTSLAPSLNARYASRDLQARQNCAHHRLPVRKSKAAGACDRAGEGHCQTVPSPWLHGRGRTSAPPWPARVQRMRLDRQGEPQQRAEVKRCAFPFHRGFHLAACSHEFFARAFRASLPGESSGRVFRASLPQDQPSGWQGARACAALSMPAGPLPESAERCDAPEP